MTGDANARTAKGQGSLSPQRSNDQPRDESPAGEDAVSKTPMIEARERVENVLAAKAKGLGYVGALTKAYPRERPWDVIDTAFCDDLREILSAYDAALEEGNRLTLAHANVCVAARKHIATAPVFRSKPVGFEGSRARLDQEDRIASEDALIDALAQYGIPQERARTILEESGRG